MDVTPINTSLSFNAIKVRRLKPVFQTNEVIFYNNRTAMLEHPMPLGKGTDCLVIAINESLSKIRDNFLDNLDIKRLNNMLEYLPKNKFRSRKIHGIIGAGCNNTAIQLDNHEVLCLSDNMGVFNSRPFEDFDLPLKSKGNYKPNNDYGWYIRNLGDPVNKFELARLAKQIKSKGYKLDDWRREQACKIGDKIYLLDYECAVKPAN